MSIINPAAVIKAVSREIYHKYGDNDIEPTGDDLTFAYLLVKMISQKFRGEQYTIKPSAAAVTPPTQAITGMPPPIIPGVVNPLGWRPPIPTIVMPVQHPIPTAIPAIPPQTTPAAKLNRPMISEQDIQRRAFMNQVSPELRDEAYDWQEYKTPDNKLYYYHSKTKERTWNKPDVIIKLDEEIAVIREQKSKQNKSSLSTTTTTTSSSPPVHSQTKDIDSGPTIDSNAQNKATSNLSNNNRSNININNPNTNDNNLHQDNGNVRNNNNDNQRDDSKTTSSSSSSSMKPVSTTAIPGTTWCVVWTDKQRVFYFNQSTKTSVWERPAELKFREDVDAIVRGEDVTSRNNSNSGGDGGSSAKRSDSENSHESNTLSYSLKRMKQ